MANDRMRRTKEYDVFIPLVLADGRSVPAATLDGYKQDLVRAFGGVTDFRHRAEGIWRVGGLTYRDEILILRVLGRTGDGEAEGAADEEEALDRLKARIRSELAQEDVLVVARDVMIL